MKSPYFVSENNEALGGEETPKATKQRNQNKIFQSQMRTFSTQCPHPALLTTRCSYLLSKFLHFIWPHSINPYLATDFCYEATLLVNYSTIQTFSEAAWSSHWNICIVCSYYFVLENAHYLHRFSYVNLRRDTWIFFVIDMINDLHSPPHHIELKR